MPIFVPVAVTFNPNCALQDFLRDAVRVLAAAFALAGSADRALYWFRSHPIQDAPAMPARPRAPKADQLLDMIQSAATAMSQSQSVARPPSPAPTFEQ